MAACLQEEGDSDERGNKSFSYSSLSSKVHTSGLPCGTTSSSSIYRNIQRDGEKAYEEVSNFDEEELHNFLEEVVNVGRRKADRNKCSTHAQLLIRKEEDALREESSSGDDVCNIARRNRKKLLLSRRDHENASVAERTSTGGSLGSLQDISAAEAKQPGAVGQKRSQISSAAARSREGGSCGNLSRGSFKTQPPVKRKKRKDASRASGSQREGGSLQNLSKTEAYSKKLQKSGSLSQVSSEVIFGVRSKHRRQKTFSESSRNSARRSEDRGDPLSSGDEVGEPGEENHPLTAVGCRVSESVVVEGSSLGGVGGGRCRSNSDEWDNDFSLGSHSDDASSSETAEEELDDRSPPSEEMLGVGPNSRDMAKMISLRPLSNDPGIGEPSEPMGPRYGYGSSYHSVDSAIPYLYKPPGEMPSQNREFSFDLNPHPGASFHSMNKSSSLDENGNPFRNCTSPQERFNIRSRNGITFLPTREGTKYDLLKAKRYKLKEKKEKDIVNIKETPGFRGEQNLDDLLKYLGEKEDTGKNKGKKKGKREESRLSLEERGGRPLEDRAGGGKRRGGLKHGGRHMEKRGGSEGDAESGGDEASAQRFPSAAGLREATSMEDLVSTSRRIANYGTTCVSSHLMPHVAIVVDEDDVARSDLLEQRAQEEMANEEEDCIGTLEEGRRSEFADDFYKAGDAFVEEVLAGPATPCPVAPAPTAVIDDFEVVSSRRKEKRKGHRGGVASSPPHGSAGKHNGWDRWSNSDGGDERANRGQGKYLRSPRGANGGSGCDERPPQLNFAEGPRTDHDQVFLNQWSQTGMGDRGCYAGGGTTSAPHSENSDSDDGDDSVHSMPVPSRSDRPVMRPQPQSTDSTPQTSYANIAKLAASANRHQMKRMSAGTLNLEDVEGIDRSLLDESFPPLSAEGGSDGAGVPLHSERSFVPGHECQIESSCGHSTTKLIHCGDVLSVVTVPATKKGDDVLGLVDSEHPVGSKKNGGNKLEHRTEVKCDQKLHVKNGQKFGQKSDLKLESNSDDNIHAKDDPKHTVEVKVDFKIPKIDTNINLKMDGPFCNKVDNKPDARVIPTVNNNVEIKTCKAVDPKMNGLTKFSQKSSAIPPCFNLTNCDKGTSHSSQTVHVSMPQRTTNHPSTTPHSISEPLLGNHKTIAAAPTTTSVQIMNRKRSEPAVVFLDNARYDLGPTGDIQFGFDFGAEEDDCLNSFMTDGTTTPPMVNENGGSRSSTPDGYRNAEYQRKDAAHRDYLKGDLQQKMKGKPEVDMNGIGEEGKRDVESMVRKECRGQTSAQDFCSWFQAPVNDRISYNYEEVLQHVSKSWDVTVRLMHEDPKNIQYWCADKL